MPTHITRLKLSHFRSHKHVALTCDARPVALFGPNGAGKTNILEAVSLFSPGRGLRRASAEEMTRRPEALGWKVSGEVEADGRIHEVESQSEAGSARQVRIDGKPAPQVALASLARVLWLIPAMDRLWIEGADGRRRFLDRMTLSFHPGHAQAVLDYEKAMRERNRLLKDQVRDPHWYRALEAQMARAGAAIHANRQSALARVTAAQQDAQTSFPISDLALETAEGGMPDGEEALRAALAESRPRDLITGRAMVGPHRADLAAEYSAKGTPARDCSTGEQKALLISLILANARALAAGTGSPPILLLDEVSAHLDASRRAALYDEICALSCQAWMTGTGPELFADLSDRAQHFEVQETDGESRIAAM
ncbi:MAG: DNA replication/repair protein RecF [Rhodobacteraceae bacterium]|nr:MAG: DNA replication/repair protein RecF [Paracoccaceae bacterium]